MVGHLIQPVSLESFIFVGQKFLLDPEGIGHLLDRAFTRTGHESVKITQLFTDIGVSGCHQGAKILLGTACRARLQHGQRVIQAERRIK